MKRLFIYQHPLPLSQEVLSKIIESLKKSLAAVNIDAEIIGLCGGEQLTEIPTDGNDLEGLE